MSGRQNSEAMAVPLVSVLAIVALAAVVLSTPLVLSLLATGALISRGSGNVAPGGSRPGSADGVVGQSALESNGGVLLPPNVMPDTATDPRGLVTGWANRAALNQYDRTNYRDPFTWQVWRDADCSAAALEWLLAAYGRPLGGIDDAIELIGAGTGISPRLGLLDARGTALSRALAARGLPPRTPGPRPLGSIVELEAWLDRGPLLMDGARWFGAGHWFVGIGYDAAGVYVRDSSGWDTRYLTWSRLYGEVGFSGWVVGVVQ